MSSSETPTFYGMFGTLRPRLCQLSPADAASYRSFYCGGCKVLGDQYGQLSRATLSYEAVCIAVMAEGLNDSSAQRSTCRCPLLPVMQRDIIGPAMASMRIAAALQLVMTEQWLVDQQLDGAHLTPLALPLLQPQAERAHRDLREAGFSLDAFKGLAQRQSALEEGQPDPLAAAEPTANALASLLYQLPGVMEQSVADTTGAEIQRNTNSSCCVLEQGDADSSSAAIEQDLVKGRTELASLGYGIGRAIYGVDALRDLRTDLSDRTFNPMVRDSRLCVVVNA